MSETGNRPSVAESLSIVELLQRAEAELRCHKTMNPCGTDTVPAEPRYWCQCPACSLWEEIREHREGMPPPQSDREAKLVEVLRRLTIHHAEVSSSGCERYLDAKDALAAYESALKEG